MATGLNAVVTQAVTETVIGSSPYNTNLASLNDAVNPSFSTVTLDVAPDGGGATVQAILFGASAHDGYMGTAGFGSTADIVLLATQNLRLDVGSGFAIFTGNAPATNNRICDGNAHGSLLVKHTISASGTITHGLGYTPTELHTEQNTAGSQTCGHDTVGSTSYHVTLGNGASSDSYAG